jgi:hypothetical protein
MRVKKQNEPASSDKLTEMNYPHPLLKKVL